MEIFDTSQVDRILATLAMSFLCSLLRLACCRSVPTHVKNRRRVRTAVTTSLLPCVSPRSHRRRLTSAKSVRLSTKLIIIVLHDVSAETLTVKFVASSVDEPREPPLLAGVGTCNQRRAAYENPRILQVDRGMLADVLGIGSGSRRAEVSRKGQPKLLRMGPKTSAFWRSRSNGSRGQGVIALTAGTIHSSSFRNNRSRPIVRYVGGQGTGSHRYWLEERKSWTTGGQDTCSTCGRSGALQRCRSARVVAAAATAAMALRQQCKRRQPPCHQFLRLRRLRRRRPLQGSPA